MLGVDEVIKLVIVIDIDIASDDFYSDPDAGYSEPHLAWRSHHKRYSK